MHTRSRVPGDGLRHKGGRFAVRSGDVPNRVLENLVPIGAFHERRKARSNFTLASAAVFVVVDFARNPLLLQKRHRLRANIRQTIDGSERQISVLGARTVAEIAGVVVDVTGPRAFVTTNLKERVLRLTAPRHTVQNKELGFRPEIRFVADSRRFKITFGTVRNRARIARIAVTGIGLNHIAR